MAGALERTRGRSWVQLKLDKLLVCKGLHFMQARLLGKRCDCDVVDQGLLRVPPLALAPVRQVVSRVALLATDLQGEPQSHRVHRDLATAGRVASSLVNKHV